MSPSPTSENDPLCQEASTLLPPVSKNMRCHTPCLLLPASPLLMGPHQQERQTPGRDQDIGVPLPYSAIPLGDKP